MDFAQGSNQLARIKPDGFGDLDEFNDVKPALAGLVFGYEGLRATQAARHVLLREPGGGTPGDQEKV